MAKDLKRCAPRFHFWSFIFQHFHQRPLSFHWYYALCNYADDNTMYSSPVDTGRKLNVHKTFRKRPGHLLNVSFTFNLNLVSTGLDKNSNIVISRLRHDFAIISEWFYENYMVLNPHKYHFLTLGFNKSFPDFSFKNTIIKNITEEKILEIVIDNNLNFKSNMKKICEKANQKLSALARISKLTNPTQRKKLINCFINSQFTYCPLIIGVSAEAGDRWFSPTIEPQMTWKSPGINP